MDDELRDLKMALDETIRAIRQVNVYDPKNAHRALLGLEEALCEMRKGVSRMLRPV